MRVFAFRFKYYNRVMSLRWATARGRKYSRFQKLGILLNAGRKIEIPFLDLDVNTVCNLRCEKCAKCIPMKKGQFFSAEKVIADLRRLLSYVDTIHALSIIGGEPFLNRDLADVITYVSSCKQIIDPDIATNGTVIPNDDVLTALKNSRLSVHISDYKYISDHMLENRKQFIEKLEAYGIPYIFFSQEHEHWLDLGDLHDRKYSKFERGQVFYQCPLNSCTIYNDKKIYRCGRSSYLNRNGKPESVMIDMDQVHSKIEMRKLIHKFYSVPFLDACNCCNKNPESIEPGIQIESKQYPYSED